VFALCRATGTDLKTTFRGGFFIKQQKQQNTKKTPIYIYILKKGKKNIFSPKFKKMLFCCFFVV